MKRTFLLFSILAMLLIPFVLGEDVNAPAPAPVYGIITVGGETEDALQVSLENLHTHEVLNWYTKYGGEIVCDMSEFTQGWSSSHNYKITYCVDDSRCDSVFKYLVDFSGGWISYDLVRKHGGLSASFPVYGTVTKDGELLYDVPVVLKNVDKGLTETIYTNEAGEFVFNLGNIGVYDTGDVIIVSYNNYSSSGLVSNIGFLDLSISISTPPKETPKDEGGGDNRGGQGEVIKPDEPEEIQEIPEEPEKVLEEIIDDTDDLKDDIPPSTTDEEPSKAFIWIMILVIVAVIGLGYWKVRKEG